MAIAQSDGSIVLTTKVDDSGLKQSTKSLKSEAAKLAAEYRKAGISKSEAMKKAWQEVNKTRKETEKATKSTKEYGEQAQKSGKTAKGAFENIKGGIKAMLVVLAVQATRAVANFAKEASTLSTTTEASVQRLVDIYGSATEAVGDFIDQNSRALGLSKAAAASYASVYGNLFSVWADQATNAELTNRYLNMTAVVASKTGRTVADVQERIRSGLLGNTEAIEDLGIFVNVKTIEMTEAFQRMANGKSWEQLDAYTQQQVRSMAILEQATAKYGNEVANTSATTRNRLKAAYEDFRATWGQVINRVLIPLFEMLTRILNVATEVSQELANVSKEIVSLPDGVENATNNANKLNKELDKTAETVKGIEKSLAGFDEIEILSSGEKAEDESQISQIELPPLDTTKTEKQTSGFVKRIVAIIQPIKSAFGELFDAIKSGFGDLYDSDLQYVGEWLGEVFVSAINNISISISTLSVIIKRVSKVFAGFWKKIEPVFEKISEFFKWFNNELKQAKNEIGDEAFWNDLATLFDRFGQIVSPIITYIGALLDIFTRFVTSHIFNAFKTVFKDIGDIIGFVAAVITGDFSSAWQHLQDLFISNRIEAVKNSFDALRTAAENTGKGVANFFVGFGTSLKDFFAQWGNGVANWWKENVAPWFTVEKWQSLAQGMVDGIANAWNKVYDFFTMSMPNWWNNNISPWFTKSRWQELWANSKRGVEVGWNSVVKFFSESLPNWWEDSVLPWFTVEKWKELGRNIKRGIINPIIEGLNWFIDQLNKFSINIPEIKGITEGYTFGFNIPKIPALAQGAVLPANKPFLAMVGDQKNGTNIETPLATMVQAFQMALNERGNDTVKEEHYYLDENEVMRIIYKLAKRGEKSQGEDLLESW
jgi:hypothetical protein